MFGTLMWEPSKERIRSTQMQSFLERTADRYGFAPVWSALHSWSVSRSESFWEEMLRWSEIRLHRPYSTVRSGDDMRSTRWFPDARFNFAEHLLRFDDDRPALIAEDERGRRRTVSHRELRKEVARFSAALRSVGVVRGDRVAGFMPNVPEAVVAMLATASLGAIWSSCSPDFGIQGVLDRFGQIGPKVLVAADGYTYNGKSIDCLERVAGIVDRITDIEQVVIVPFLEESPRISTVRTARLWSEFSVADDLGRAEPVYESVPFDHPLYIMYSSGTTGVPKCIVHGAGGTLLQHMKEHVLHGDLHRNDVMFYFTTCGWMMWNWLVSALGVGATVVLYEGSPTHPAPDTLWKLAERLGITVFGTSPKFISACSNAGLHPSSANDLGRLRTVLSTGSPLTVENFRWVYEEVKGDLQLSSISGGTDIISCFMLGNPILPVYSGEIQCLGLGMDVHAFDESGKPVIGKKGELVCCRPFPSQPTGFWNDPDGEKYRRAYFDSYPGIWRHGDFVEITPRGGVVVYGRSDATLNPGGVRIGTAEIYRIVESMDEVVDSVVVGKETQDADVEICLFVVLRDGRRLDDALTSKIKKRIAEGATKRHAPQHVRQVTAVPYTISGKKVELAVSQMIHGRPVPNRDALANPASLEQYRGLI